MVFLTTRTLPTDGDNAKYDDSDFEMNKDRINAELDSIEALKDNETPIIFVSSGYGKYMSSPKAGDKNTFQAERTYDVLSKELYDRFGFENPGARFFPSTKQRMIEAEENDIELGIFEKEMNQQVDEVLEKIDNCK